MQTGLNNWVFHRIMMHAGVFHVSGQQETYLTMDIVVNL
jgi:hypothetical protein